MGKEVLGYLSPRDAEKIVYWASDLGPLIERNLRLSNVDLVIEGGVGTSRTMVHMMRKVFPSALYVGMDVAEQLSQGRPWLSKSIDEETLQRILDANKHPDMLMEGAMVKASCFDFDLILDIMRKAGRSVPLLATFRALYSLMSTRERNPFEKKQSEIEIVTVKGLTSFQNPFFAQIHIPFAEDLETAAAQAGWQTDKFDIGLLLYRNT